MDSLTRLHKIYKKNLHARRESLKGMKKSCRRKVKGSTLDLRSVLACIASRRFFERIIRPFVHAPPHESRRKSPDHKKPYPIGPSACKTTSGYKLFGAARTPLLFIPPSYFFSTTRSFFSLSLSLFPCRTEWICAFLSTSHFFLNGFSARV